MSEITPVCPRMTEDGKPFEGPGSWSPDGICTYCGSIKPSTFFELIEGGVEVEPTDKNYKAYIAAPGVRGAGKFYFQHFSAADRKKFIELYNNKTMKIGYPGHFYNRPFFCTPLDAEKTAYESNGA